MRRPVRPEPRSRARRLLVRPFASARRAERISKIPGSGPAGEQASGDPGPRALAASHVEATAQSKSYAELSQSNSGHAGHPPPIPAPFPAKSAPWPGRPTPPAHCSPSRPRPPCMPRSGTPCRSDAAGWLRSPSRWPRWSICRRPTACSRRSGPRPPPSPPHRRTTWCCCRSTSGTRSSTRWPPAARSWSAVSCMSGAATPCRPTRPPPTP